MASRIAAVGRVTVSERKSIGEDVSGVDEGMEDRNPDWERPEAYG